MAETAGPAGPADSESSDDGVMGFLKSVGRGMFRQPGEAYKERDPGIFRMTQYIDYSWSGDPWDHARRRVLTYENLKDLHVSFVDEEDDKKKRKRAEDDEAAFHPRPKRATRWQYKGTRVTGHTDTSRMPPYDWSHEDPDLDP